MTKGIETSYNGCLFRSRLEARWAAMFDLLDWHWTYEPGVDAHKYIPDFVIHGESPLMVEVKPAIVANDYEAAHRRSARALGDTWTGDILIIGIDPVVTAIDNWTTWGIDGYPAAGLMDEGPDGCLDAGLWATCRRCDQPAIFHSIGSYKCRPCGHYEGDHLIGEIEPSDLLNRWNIAHTLTRWTA